MIDARDLPDALVWHEGLLLAPQHFQETERRQGLLAAVLARAAERDAWGVLDLVIDRRLLADGLFRVDGLAAILPDGLVVSHPKPGDGALEIALDVGALDDAGALTVHLTVLAERRGAEVGEARFRTRDGEPVADLLVSDSVETPPRLVPILGLHVSSSPRVPPPSRFTSLPLARVAHRDDRYELVAFTPPAPVLAVDDPSLHLARDTATRLREQCVMWSERLSRRDPSTDVGRQVDWAAVRAMHAGLPRLEALLGAGPPTPRRLFLALGDIVGQVAGLDGEPVPPALPAYDHRDPLPAFRAAALTIGRILDRLRAPYRTVPFTLADGTFSVVLEPDWTARELVVGVRAPVGTPVEAAAAWFRQAVVSSSSRQESARLRRTLGAGRRVVPRVPALELEPPRDTVLFVLEDEAEEALVGGEPLEVWVAQPPPGAVAPRELVLYLPLAP